MGPRIMGSYELVFNAQTCCSPEGMLLQDNSYQDFSHTFGCRTLLHAGCLAVASPTFVVSSNTQPNGSFMTFGL
jgi:hypothetical protein